MSLQQRIRSMSFKGLKGTELNSFQDAVCKMAFASAQLKAEEFAAPYDALVEQMAQALRKLLAFHTESADFTPEALNSVVKFEEFVAAIKAQKKAAEEAARAALAAHAEATK